MFGLKMYICNVRLEKWPDRVKAFFPLILKNEIANFNYSRDKKGHDAHLFVYVCTANAVSTYQNGVGVLFLVHLE